ncbi:alpha/beta hydrolase [Paenibacillus puerhi]|uniref:alpha/beta hydrolase n=1 Tax=Paenibacillus puerhi TaxID=2692622 RepID=UPI0013584C10|nr:alpha/beta hydrolase [Paenibacillus puerhi]
MQTRFDVSYAMTMSETRVLDLWLPEDTQRNGAAILFIHGGAWIKGNKKQFQEVAEWFCQRGFVCASMKYRFSDQYNYPAAVEDARLAMQFLRSQASDLGFDPERLAAVGSSAGGYLAAMLALIGLEDELGHTEELQSRHTQPNAVALYCPVTTLHGGQDFVRDFMGVSEAEAPELYREASPVDRIQGGEPPFLIVQGDADTLTPLEEAVVFTRKLQAAGSHAELTILPGVGHGFGYGIGTEAQKAACEAILAFFESTLVR